MSDLDDLNHAIVLLQRLKFNALTGSLLLGDTELGAGSRWVGDMLTRRRGVGRTGDGVFEFYLTPVGSAPPTIPEDDKFKPAVAMIWWSPEDGLAEMITNGSILRRTISDYWETYKTYQEAADGMLPLTEFGPPREVKVGRTNIRVFWTPVLTVIGWIPREDIPALKYRPPTVPPPIRRDQQVPFRPTAMLPSAKDRRKTSAPAKDRQRGSAPDPLSEILDDEIPELGGVEP